MIKQKTKLSAANTTSDTRSTREASGIVKNAKKKKMKNELWFHIKTPYVLTGQDELKAMGKCVWSTEQQKMDWWFKIADMDQVVAILGKTPEFDEADVLKAVDKCPLVKKAIDMEEWKGKGTIEVEEQADCYICKTPRKVVDKDGNIEIKWLEYEIPTENVKACLNAVQKVKNRPAWRTRNIPSPNIAEQYCKDLNLTRFFRPTSDSFDYDKFFGTRKEAYFPFYYSLKVLAHEGYILYGKGSKYVTVLQKTWLPEAQL